MLELWQVNSEEITYRQKNSVMTEYVIAVKRWDEKTVVRETFSRHEIAMHIRVAKDLNLPYSVRVKSKTVRLGWYPQCILCKARDCEYGHAHCERCCDCPEWPF